MIRNLEIFSCDLHKKIVSADVLVRERPLMTSDIRVGRGVQDIPKIRHYRVGQGR